MNRLTISLGRYNRNLQNPGGACSPSPCGENTNCMVNGQVSVKEWGLCSTLHILQGNPICQCIPGFIPFPSPIDGCCEPYENPNSRVLTPPQTDPCSPTPCGPGTTCSVQGGNAICRCQDGFSPNPDTITGCKPECQRDPDCRMGFQCRWDYYLDSSDPFSSTCFSGQYELLQPFTSSKSTGPVDV